jgi:hypothetical protein
LFREAGAISDTPLDIRVLYSKTNQFVSYKQIEDILKLTHDKRSQDSAVARLTVIGGGHDVLRDNPNEVFNYLGEIFDINFMAHRTHPGKTTLTKHSDESLVPQGKHLKIDDRDVLQR